MIVLRSYLDLKGDWLNVYLVSHSCVGEFRTRAIVSQGFCTGVTDHYECVMVRTDHSYRGWSFGEFLLYNRKYAY